MASNVEGEALKRMSGATAKPGGISKVVAAMAADRWLGGGKDKATAKSAADWENEAVANDLEFARQGTRRDWMKEDIEAHGRTKSMAYGADGGAKWEAYQSPTGRTGVKAGGAKQTPSGTSGNTKGAQFKRTVGKAVKEAAVSGAGAVAGAAVGAVTKSPKAAAAASTLGSAAAESAISAVAKRRTGKSSAV